MLQKDRGSTRSIWLAISELLARGLDNFLLIIFRSPPKMLRQVINYSYPIETNILEVANTYS